MVNKRSIEIFSAGCAVCDDAVKQVKDIACSSCEVTILDMHQPSIAARAKTLGIKSLPAVVIDGQLTDCCSQRGVDVAVLKAAGIGTTL